MATSKGRKFRRLTEVEILELLRTGVYKVDPKTAEVTGPEGIVKPERQKAGRRVYSVIRMYNNGARRGIMRPRLVWMSVTGSLVPPGFEIHHDDESSENDAWENLICLHKLDHLKQHSGKPDQADEIPF